MEKGENARVWKREKAALKWKNVLGPRVQKKALRDIVAKLRIQNVEVQNVRVQNVRENKLLIWWDKLFIFK